MFNGRQHQELTLSCYNEIDRCIGDMMISQKMQAYYDNPFDLDELMMEVADRFKDRVKTHIKEKNKHE